VFLETLIYIGTNGRYNTTPTTVNVERNVYVHVYVQFILHNTQPTQIHNNTRKYYNECQRIDNKPSTLSGMVK